MKLKKTILALCVAGTVLGSGIRAEAYYTPPSNNYTYIYNEFGWVVETPDAYEFAYSVDLRALDGYDVTNLIDMCVKENGELFVLETTLGVVFCFDSQQNYVGVMKEFTMPDGSVTTLSKPEGIYVSEKDEMYICDTGNSRVLVCDRKGNVSLEVVKPENIIGTSVSSFLPIKAVADSAGRISIVARNVNRGIMQFTKEGVFTGYMGAPAVQVDALTKLLRKFYSDEQLATMTTYVPTEYNNIKIDGNNFIWGTISAISNNSVISTISGKDLSGKVTPIKKLNMMGTDVLVRKDVYPPIGDLMFVESPSKIVDVGLGPNKIYTMLDSTQGRFFTYNNDGILLYAFGGKGTAKGEVQTPIAIDYVSDKIVVLDSGLRSLLVYEPTLYGGLLVSAEGYFLAGNYTDANNAWKQVTELNSNFKYPYIGLGNAEYNSGKYEEAMDYYEYADARTPYSNAKEKLRKASLSVSFPYIVSAILVFIVLFVGKGIFLRIRKYVRGELVTYGEEEE
jgi:hypothetical protein